MVDDSLLDPASDPRTSGVNHEQGSCLYRDSVAWWWYYSPTLVYVASRRDIWHQIAIENMHVLFIIAHLQRKPALTVRYLCRKRGSKTSDAHNPLAGYALFFTTYSEKFTESCHTRGHTQTDYHEESIHRVP